MHFSKYNNALMHYYKSSNEIMQYCIFSNDIALIMHYRALLKGSGLIYLYDFEF